MSMAERLVSPEGEARTDMKRYYNLSYVIYGPEQSTEPDKYMAEIPALPGCRAWGDTPGETIEILESLAPAFIELQLEQGEIRAHTRSARNAPTSAL